MSPEFVLTPQLTSKIYSLFLLSKYFIVLVASPKAIGKNPDAKDLMFQHILPYKS